MVNGVGFERYRSLPNRVVIILASVFERMGETIIPSDPFQPVSQRVFEPGTSRIQVYGVTTALTCSVLM
jgi:hypothetical protein